MTASRIITRSGLDLSILDAKRYSSHPFKDHEAQLTQREVNFRLYEIFTKGAHDVNCNPAWAHYYFLKAMGASPEEAASGAFDSMASVLGKLTTPRLFLVRFDRVLSLSFIAKAFLPRFFGFFGLSYFLEFALLLGANCYEAYRAMKPMEGESKWGAFKRAYNNALALNPKRKYRMDNALRWGPINLISSFLGPIPFAIINIWGFYRDVTNEWDSERGSQIRCDTRLIEQIQQLEKEKEDLEITLPKLRQELEDNQAQDNTNELKQQLTRKTERLALLNQNITSLKNQKTVVKNDIRSPLIKDQAKEIFIVALILIAVILYATPGLNAAAFAVGAFFAFAASVYCMHKRYKELKTALTKKDNKAATFKPTTDVSDGNILRIIDNNTIVSQSPERHNSPTLVEESVSPSPLLVLSSPSPISESNTPIVDEPSGDTSRTFTFPNESAHTINVLFLYHILCKIEQVSEAEGATQSEDLAIFSKFDDVEIEKFRLILCFLKQVTWQEQLSLWSKKQKSTPIENNCPVKKDDLYHCSIKQTLFYAILQERNHIPSAGEGRNLQATKVIEEIERRLVPV